MCCAGKIVWESTVEENCVRVRAAVVKSRRRGDSVVLGLGSWGRPQTWCGRVKREQPSRAGSQLCPFPFGTGSGRGRACTARYRASHPRPPRRLLTQTAILPLTRNTRVVSFSPLSQHLSQPASSQRQSATLARPIGPSSPPCPSSAVLRRFGVTASNSLYASHHSASLRSLFP
ncbi:hypothetical protein K461DRAFT_115130 [Myriangium duriaei CBS 260.36]|uniref:Uncharacterized protein n=1 Tax=Myriangium duriaei CBS 260.36 TaxID=1168546 RepID=A0A9P4MI14_9PEZI|nr:hypothetical protein K461DRAFT_115130 [Myriangium duriaei CBS 260.36]